MLVARYLPGELERLHVVACAELTPLTSTSPRHTARLAEWIASERSLRHPLLVSKIGGRTVVLDGNSRLSAARRLDLPDLLVQELPSEFLPDPLRMPAMAVLGIGREVVERVLEEDFVRVGSPPADALVVHLPGGEIRAQAADGVQPRALWSTYKRIVTALAMTSDVVPVSRGTSPLLHNYPPAPHDALVVPPPLDLDTLGYLSLLDAPLPWGAMQVPFPRRILGINLSLAVLRAPERPEEKTDFVRDLVRLRLSERRVHLYDAPVYLFEP
jgi:hypothetical protein